MFSLLDWLSQEFGIPTKYIHGAPLLLHIVL